MNGIKESCNTRRGQWRVLFALAFVVFCVLCLNGCADKDDEGNETKPATAAANSANPTGPKLTINTVTASNSGTTNAAPANTIDGDLKTQWSSAGPAPQWIQLDLGEESSVSKLRLNVSQTPTGPTTHQIYGGSTPDNLKLLGTLDGVTQEGQWLELPLQANNVRYLKIATVKSPSWIAWREIEVFK